jgi:mycothiol system anti-sigma-R factor
MPMADGCREVLDDLERYLDGECPDQLEAVIAEHLADCPPCLSRSDFERALRDLVARQCRDTAPSSLLDRVLGELR